MLTSLKRLADVLGNPYKGSAKIFCQADTAKGVFAANFTTDGSIPKAARF
jgi:hypothetical protein